MADCSDAVRVASSCASAMDAVAVTPMSRLSDFLYSPRNIAGCCLAFAGLVLLFTGVIDTGWPLIVAGLYAVGVLQNFCRELLQQAAPVGRRHLLPHGVVALARGMHGGIDVVGRAALDLVKRLAVGRVDHRDGAAGGGRNGGVGDEVQLHGQIVRQKQCVLMVFRQKWPIALMY